MTQENQTDRQDWENRPVRSFVRRMGRVSNAQTRFFQEVMPEVGIAYSKRELALPALFGRAAAPKILEIGCGMGEATASIARENPQNDYLGIEIHVPGLGNLCKLIAEHDITNLRLIAHDAVEVLHDMVPMDSLDGVHIFFPDPWPKKRHHKRRLIQAPFAALLATRLKQGGYVHVATDWVEYATQVLAVFDATPSLFNKNHQLGFVPRPEYRPQTKFERRGLKLGHGIRDVIFQKE